uniref:Uncharacterized protein n=1 Tax=Heterorhabditis bacteriophora TaxID=37862 RepID=A0A1I7WUJ9_HETBA
MIVCMLLRSEMPQPFWTPKSTQYSLFILMEGPVIQQVSSQYCDFSPLIFT